MIPVAHGAETGPSLEAVVVGLAGLALGVVFLARRDIHQAAAVAAIVTGALVLAGAFTVFASEHDHAPGSETISIAGDRVPAAQLRAGVGALCDSIEAAGPEDEERIFFDRAHEEMHLLAQALERDHRARAAELLEAKQRVEADLAADSPSSSASLSRLRGSAARGLELLSIEPPECAQ